MNIDKALGIHPQALNIRARRAELLANNLANSDTPHFKARDVDVNGMLQAQQRGGSLSMQRTQGGHLGSQTGLPPAAVQYRVAHQPTPDGNTVDTQLEKARYAENALRYSASVTFLKGNFKGLLTAIRGE